MSDSKHTAKRQYALRVQQDFLTPLCVTVAFGRERSIAGKLVSFFEFKLRHVRQDFASSSKSIEAFA